MATKIFSSGAAGTRDTKISDANLGGRPQVIFSNEEQPYQFQSDMGEQQLLRDYNPHFTWTNTLINGNAVITYWAWNLSNGYFQIIDENGNKVKDHTAFASGYPTEFAVAPLDNGSFVIQWGTSGHGKFAIFDATGSKIVNDTTYKSNRVLLPVPKQMSNGNIALSFNDKATGDQDGEYMVYDITGSYTGDQYNFQVGTAYQKQPILANTSEGKLMIIWADSTYDLKGRTMIPNVTASDFRDNISTPAGSDAGPAGKGAELVDGNIAFLYAGTSYIPTFLILDKDIQTVSAKRIGSGSITYYNGDCVPLLDGRFFVAWRSAANPDYSGSFKTISADGSVTSSATTIGTSSIHNLRATRIGEGKVIVTYEAASKIFYRIIS